MLQAHPPPRVPPQMRARQLADCLCPWHYNDQSLTGREKIEKVADKILVFLFGTFVSGDKHEAKEWFTRRILQSGFRVAAASSEVRSRVSSSRQIP